MITARSEQVLAEFLNSPSRLQNFIIQDGAWTIRNGDYTDPGTTFSAIQNKIIWGGYIFNSLDLTSSSATPVSTTLVLAGGSKANTGTATLYRNDSNAAVSILGTTQFDVTNPFEVFFLTIKNRCFIAARTPAAGVVPSIVSHHPVNNCYPWGVDAPATELTYVAFGNATVSGTKTYFTANGAGATLNGTSVTKSAGVGWDTGWAGKTVYLDNVKYRIVSVTGASGPMTIDPKYAGATDAALNIKVTYGDLTWTGPGPKYAVAKYDETTGHISNMGPVMHVSEQDQSDVNVYINTIELDNDPRFQHLVLFRTELAGGVDLEPFKLDPSHLGTAVIENTVGSAARYMIKNNTVGTVTYVDTLADSQAKRILGDVVGPTRNFPPPADIKYMAFWDGRVWCSTVSAPFRVQFSASPEDVTIGVVEECFPALNYRDVSADDGFITGMRIVGSSLLISTERYLYVVDSGPYRLTRISSRGAGVNHWAMDEHPGDSSEQSASALYVARDKRLWRQFPGGRIEDIGWPIQDKLDLIDANTLRPVVLRVVQVRKQWLLALGIRITPVGQVERYSYLFYDFDRQSWHDFGYGVGFFDSGYNPGAERPWGTVINGIYYTSNATGIPYAALGGDGEDAAYGLETLSTSPVTGIILTTQWLDLGDKAGKKSLQYVNVHTDIDPTLLFVYAYFDGAVAPFTLALMTETVSETSPRYPGGGLYRFLLPLETSTFADITQNQFHTVKVLVASDPAAVVGQSVFKIEVGYTVESTGISGGSN